MGFDIEWPVSTQIPATIQLCHSATEICVIIQCSDYSAESPLPECLERILGSSEITKAGVGAGGDATRLRNRFGISLNGVVDINSLIPGKTESLQKLCKDFLGLDLDKGPVRVSNWAAETLSDDQISYAASDAYACSLIYEKINGSEPIIRQPEPTGNNIVQLLN